MADEARQVFEEEHPDSTLLLLAIEDVTQRRDTEREKDELLRQKGLNRGLRGHAGPSIARTCRCF